MLDTFRVEIKDKEIVFQSGYHEGLFKQRLEQLEGKKITLKIDEKKPKRSEQQNRYYWLYLRIITEETGHTKDELHGLFSGMFLTSGITEVMGKPVRIKKSTTSLTKSEFSEYIMEIEEFTGISSPDTTEYTRGGVLINEGH